MPKKAPGMTPEEQRLKFEAIVRKMVKAGDFDRTDARKRLDRITKLMGKPRE